MDSATQVRRSRQGDVNMVEVLRSNDPVLLSFVTALFSDSDIEAIIFDTHTSILEGSIGAVPRRVMVIDEDAIEALQLLAEAKIIDERPSD